MRALDAVTGVQSRPCVRGGGGGGGWGIILFAIIEFSGMQRHLNLCKHQKLLNSSIDWLRVGRYVGACIFKVTMH